MSYSQVDEQPGERGFARSIECRDQVGRRFFAHPLEACDLLQLECKDIRETGDQIRLDELVDEFLAETVDVEGTSAGEVAEVVLQLGGAVDICAARDSFAFESDRFGRTDRTVRWLWLSRESVALFERFASPTSFGTQ